MNNFAHDTGNKALISYSPTSTQLGLELLQAHRLDVCCIHWGPAIESRTRHPALLQHFSQHENWVLIRAFKREHGLMIKPELLNVNQDPGSFFDLQYRWVMRQTGSGTLRFLQEMLSQHGKTIDKLNTEVKALSEHEAAAAIAMDLADIAAGARGVAKQHGLGFIHLGWETVDFALPRRIWFRHLFQDLIRQLKSVESQQIAEQLGGYNFEGVGELVWGAD